MPSPLSARRHPFGAAGFALVLLTVPASGRAEVKPDTDELIAAIDKAFAAPRESLKPPVVIFPMLGADDRVTADGDGFSYLAAFAAVYPDHRRMDLCVPLTRDVFTDAGCRKAKSSLDKETIRLCLAALGAKLYAVPKLVGRDNADVLTIDCHGDGDKYRDRTFTHTIAPRDRRRVPGLIARSVLEYLDVALTPENRERIAAPSVRDESDFRALLAAEAGRLSAGGKATDLLALLDRNPRCALAWELALTSHATRVEALRRFHQLRPPLECGRPHLSAAVQVRDLGEPARALRMLLPYAASHRGDTYYHSTMIRCAMRLQDERLVRHVLESWRKDEPGYSGCVMRGSRLIDWAWDARGSDWGHKVTPEGSRLFVQRLREAGRELTEALRINPAGWTAHGQFLTVTRGLGAPRPIMEDHFRRAVKLRPRYVFAYESKLESLKPRWGGEPEELLEFGRECARTGYWDELIPRVFSLALQDLATVPSDSGQIYQVFKAPEVWDGAREYYRGAQKGADPPARQLALNELVRWGIYGGHFDDDLVVACQRLRGQWRVNEIVWPDRAELEFFYNLVHARTGRLKTQLFAPRRNDLGLAKTAAALAEGDYAQAAQAIEQIEPGSPVSNEEVASYRSAIAAARRLAHDKHIDLKGADGLRPFLGARPRWQFSGDRFVCNLPANSHVALTFPLGISHGVLRGTVDWSDGISYAQIVTHTRAPRDQVILRYLPNNTVQLIRNNVLLQQSPRPAGPFAFRLVYDGRMDQLQPAPGVAWQAGVYDDVPSGFAFQIFTTHRPAVVTLSDLHVELTD